MIFRYVPGKAVMGRVRSAAATLRDAGFTFETGAFADDHEDRDQIAAIACQRGSRLLKKNLRGEEILVVGDTPLDIRCARAIGAKAIAVTTGWHTRDELEASAPDLLLPDLQDAAILLAHLSS